MDRIWQWAWDRYAARYSWAVCAVTFFIALPIYLVLALVIVGFERSSRFAEASAIAVATAAVLVYGMALPSVGQKRIVELWAAGCPIGQAQAIEATYAWTRGSVVRTVAVTAVCAVAHSIVVASVSGATGWRLAQYGFLGLGLGTGTLLIALHSCVEGAVRPARVAIAGDSGIGESLPRTKPSFAAWSALSMLATAFSFALAGAMLAAVLDRTDERPFLVVAIACALTLVFGVPMTVGAAFSPSLQPVRDLAEGTDRVAIGDYSQRLPVVQDDDLGALAASFNRMQAGRAERQRLQVAFGTYVDPALAARLLEQGDDVFTGERREVTVIFVDVRDFTPFAESNPAEAVVSRLNALFEIVVPAVVGGGGHVNKFLGDGALAVFGAPNDLAGHADAAVNAALVIHRLVAEQFKGELRIGIGINTGLVIAGTIGGSGKLEFTLIGDTVNVAARVEQLTKNTGDAILLTDQTVDALISRPLGLIDRGAHALKGKSAPTAVFGLDPAVGQ